jgi:hypothetical protein
MMKNSLPHLIHPFQRLKYQPIIHGSKDMAVPVEESKRAAELIPVHNLK